MHLVMIALSIIYKARACNVNTDGVRCRMTSRVASTKHYFGSKLIITYLLARNNKITSK